MVPPKKSSNTEITVAKCQPSVTPSKIPRPDSRSDRPLSVSTKPSRSNVAPQAAVFDLNGRLVKKSRSKDDCPVSVQTAEAASSKGIICDPSEPLMIAGDRFIRQQVNQDMLQRDGSVTIRTIRTVSVDNSTTATLAEISNKPSSSFLVGDNAFNGRTLQVSQSSQAIFNYIHEEDNMPSSTTFEGNRVLSQCSFVNICREAHSEPTPKWGFPWVAFWNGFMALMIALLLAITFLVNYDQLMAIWHGYELKKDFVLPIEETYFEKWVNYLLKLWMKVRNCIVLDECNEEL